MKGLVVLVLLACLATAQHQALIDYLERRLLAIEDRISLWHEQTARYAAELRELKQQMVAQLESLDKEKEVLRGGLDSVGTRVDRVERELDYLETQNGAQPCVDVDDKLIEQQVTLVEEKQQTKYLQPSDCSDMISSIKAMKIVKHAGGPRGSWSRDSGPGPGPGRVYLFNGTDGHAVHHFPSVQDLARWQGGLSSSPQLALPSGWSGTGHVVHAGHVYYVSQPAQGAEPSVVKYSVRNGSVADSAVFPAPGGAPVYGLGAHSALDLALDEDGLWAVYASPREPRHLALAKVDAGTLAVEHTWDTGCSRQDAEAAFVVCGTLYVVYNTRQPGRSRIQCAFDAHGVLAPEDAPLVYFPKRYAAHASLKYEPQEQLLYAWDDGYQILYRLAMKKKLEV